MREDIGRTGSRKGMKNLKLLNLKFYLFLKLHTLSLLVSLFLPPFFSLVTCSGWCING